MLLSQLRYFIYSNRYTKAFEPFQYSHCSDKWETSCRQYLFASLTGQLLYPLPQVEGVPGPSDNSGLQDESAPVGEGHGPNCRMTPGKVHVYWGID